MESFEQRVLMPRKPRLVFVGQVNVIAPERRPRTKLPPSIEILSVMHRARWFHIVFRNGPARRFAPRHHGAKAIFFNRFWNTCADELRYGVVKSLRDRKSTRLNSSHVSE